jgi:hypothetical protein
VSTLPVLEIRPPSAPEPSSRADELTLSELLELFAPEDPAAAPASTRSSLRSAAARLGAVVQGWSRRAAQWGAVPGMPGLRGDRSSQLATGQGE